MKHKFRVVAGVVFAILLIWIFVFLYGKSRPKVVIYEIINPKTETVQKTTVATGAVEPRDEVLIKPQISGIISEIYKKSGEKVSQGEVIAKIQVVPEMGALNSAENNVKLTKIRLDHIQLEWDRAKQLYDGKVISAEEFDTKNSELSVAKTDYQNAQNNLEIIRTGIISRSENAGNTQVRATISGTILDIPIKVGNSVIQSNTFNDGTTIASVADMTNMIFRGKVDETEIGKINQGTQAKIVIGALQEQNLNASIEYVSPKGLSENGVIMFEIKAAVHIPDSVFIRSGYSANAEIVTEKRDSVMTITESSVIFEDDKAYVEILTSDPKDEKTQKFERREVTLGISNGVLTEVLSGLAMEDNIKGLKKDDKEARKDEKK